VLHVRRWERRGDGFRVEFLCGGRVLRDLRVKQGIVTRLAAGFTVGPDELEASVARSRDAEDRARKRLAAVLEQLLDYESRELVAQASAGGGPAVVCRVYSDRSVDEIKGLARAIAGRGGIALLGLRAEKAQVVFASAAESRVDCGSLLRQTLAQFGGRGGGQTTLAQGGLPDVTMLDQALAAAAQALAGDR
jgi:alanyl-tRNA synthetase